MEACKGLYAAYRSCRQSARNDLNQRYKEKLTMATEEPSSKQYRRARDRATDWMQATIEERCKDTKLNVENCLHENCSDLRSASARQQEKCGKCECEFFVNMTKGTFNEEESWECCKAFALHLKTSRALWEDLAETFSS